MTKESKIQSWIRPNIAQLKPYSSARHEFEGQADVYLDANENPFEQHLYHRYPDPLQWKLKSKISELKSIAPESIFLGNGSDEAIDLLIRIFCEPGQDHIVIVEPTYGMYRVAADINNVKVKTHLLTKDFQLPITEILTQQEARDKILFLCSPNNPTGNLLSANDVRQAIEGFDGIVVVDEAYIDFSDQPSWIDEIAQYENLVVLQTFSKSWGMAGLRLGMAFAQPAIIRIFNAVKPPYNINQYTQDYVHDQLGKEEEVRSEIAELLKQRKILSDYLNQNPWVDKVHPSQANFILFTSDKARQIFEYLRAAGIVIRDRSQVVLCENGLRLTVGNPRENQIFIEKMEGFKP